jgi:hypothetical protein
VTFNPTAPGIRMRVLLDHDHNDALVDVACPSASQCTAINARGIELTFNPQPRGTPSPQCVVPKLEGKTLTQAKKLLGRAHCRLGKVTQPATHKHKLVVVSQNPAAKKTLPSGTKVGVRLG